MSLKPKVIVKDLTKSFERPVLDHLSFQVYEGEIFGIIGPSGAGKTTLIHCLTGLETPTSGEIWMDGELISQLQGKALRQARRKIGMVFQQFHLFSSRHVLDNVRYPLEICGREEDVRPLLELVGLQGKEYAYPAELSGGQKQRVALARALALSPSVLLCDEPTSALDPQTAASLLQLLSRLNQELQMTIILITHEMDVVKQICHRVAVLDQGHIVEQGSVMELISHPQHTVTKKFLAQHTQELPKHMCCRKPKTALWQLRFIGTCAEHPIISQLIRLYPVDVNILLGSIEVLQAGTVGHLVVELSGESQVLQEARQFLEKQGVMVEEAFI